MVFVGYGITAPEQRWDDWKDADVRGKVVLVMNNDPESDPELFAGKRRLYYGRWSYKYEEAARQADREVRQAQREAPRYREPRAEPRPRAAPRSNRQGAGQAFGKSVLRSLGSGIGRESLRGILGGFRR